MSLTAYPLAWPTGWKRTALMDRKPARFCKRVKHASFSWKTLQDLSIGEATRRVMAELDRMGLGPDDVVVSSNLKLRLDGLPRADQKEPLDSGVAVYWQEKGGSHRVIAIDRYTRVADNLAAIAATLDAMRAIDRHGGAVVMERAFTGFTALPAPDGTAWWEVLGISEHASRKEVDEAYRTARSTAHPDKGGSADAFDAVEKAYKRATAA